MKARLVLTSTGLIRGSATDFLRTYTKSSVDPANPGEFVNFVGRGTARDGALAYDLSHNNLHNVEGLYTQYGDDPARTRVLGTDNSRYSFGPIKFLDPPENGYTEGSFANGIDPFEDVDVKYWIHEQKCRIESKSYIDYITDGVQLNLSSLADVAAEKLAGQLAGGGFGGDDLILGGLTVADYYAGGLTREKIYFDQNSNTAIDFIAGPKQWLEFLFGGNGRPGVFKGRLKLPEAPATTSGDAEGNVDLVSVSDIEAIEASETYTDSMYSTNIIIPDKVEDIDDCDYNPFTFTEDIASQFIVETNYQYFVPEYERSIANEVELYSSGQETTVYNVSENSLPDANMFQQVKDTYSSPMFIKKDNVLWDHVSLYNLIPGDPFSWTSTHFTNMTNEHGGEGQVKNLATPSGQGEMYKYLQKWGELTRDPEDARSLTSAQKNALYNVGAYSNAFTSDGVFKHAITDHFIAKDSDLGTEARPRVFPMYSKIHFNKNSLQDKGTGAPKDLVGNYDPLDHYDESQGLTLAPGSQGLVIDEGLTGGFIDKVFDDGSPSPAPSPSVAPDFPYQPEDAAETLLDFPTAVADKIKEFGLTKSILKYLMLATPPNIKISQVDPATNEPVEPIQLTGEGFYLENYTTHENFGETTSAQKYNASYNVDGDRRVWLMDDILGNFNHALKSPSIFDGVYDWGFNNETTPEGLLIATPVVKGKGASIGSTAEDYEAGIVDASAKIFCDFFYGSEKQDLGYFESFKEGPPIDGGISYYFGGKKREVDFFNSSFLSTQFAEAKMALNDFNHYLSDRSRAYCQIYEQKIKFPKEDLRETIAYRIEKIKVSYANNLLTANQEPEHETIRNMYFLNNSDFNIVEFMDTQVKYGNPTDSTDQLTAYMYKVYAYDLVYSTNYSYSLNIPQGDADANELNNIGNLIYSYFSDDATYLPYNMGDVGWFYPNYYDAFSTQASSPGVDAQGLSPQELEILEKIAVNGTDYINILLESGDDDKPSFDITFPHLMDAIKTIKNNYENSPLEPGNGNNISMFSARFFANFTVISRPGLKIVEQPIYQTEPIIVASRPPIAPDIEILPYQNLPNQVMIKLSSNSGRHKVPATPILSEDVSKIMNTYFAQGMTLDRVKEEQQFFNQNGRFKTKLTHENDDHQTKFQFFEISGIDHSKVGIEYTDFSEFEVVDGEHSSFFFNKAIIPNRKYYFTCRAIDKHEQLSIPSPIYEFEMVQDGGDGFLLPVFKEFKQPVKNNIQTKKVKKYISVKPGPNQTILGEKLYSDELETIEFKEDVKTFLNKKFKMRLTSKHTGRKIDVNFRFKINKKGYVEDISTVTEDGSNFRVISSLNLIEDSEQVD